MSRGVGPFLLAVPVGQPPVVGLPEYSEVATSTSGLSLRGPGRHFFAKSRSICRTVLPLRSRSRSTTFDLGQVLDPAIVFRFLHPFA